MPDDVDDSTADLSDHMSDLEDDGDIRMTDKSGDNTNGEPKKKYDPKDPSRPRRKKARRACFACQRAHLTCGKYSASAIAQSLPGLRGSPVFPNAHTPLTYNL